MLVRKVPHLPERQSALQIGEYLQMHPVYWDPTRTVVKSRGCGSRFQQHHSLVPALSCLCLSFPISTDGNPNSIYLQGHWEGWMSAYTYSTQNPVNRKKCFLAFRTLYREPLSLETDSAISTLDDLWQVTQVSTALLSFRGKMGYQLAGFLPWLSCETIMEDRYVKVL